jgi:nickel/cobalt transporter (NicO) family protein
MPVTVVRGARGVLAIVAVTMFVIIVSAAADMVWAQTPGFGGPHPLAFGGIAGWVLAKQAMFYRSLAGMIRTAKNDGSALWALMGVSFVYGIFHAAGPGHGKAVISSYLLANEETWRRGITLSFASAVMQSLTAIAIVGIAAILLGATAKFMGDTVRLVEIVSYGLIIVVGARLFWVKSRGLVRVWRAREQPLEDSQTCGCTNNAQRFSAGGGSGSAYRCDQTNPDHTRLQHAGAGRHRAHDHDHGHDYEEEPDLLPWGHAHGPEPQGLAGPGGWRRGWSAVLAVGLRPCSGAIIVLVFALAQGLFWAGMASTIVMGLGTAITVATIATLAVGAKAIAKRFANARGGSGILLLRAIETGAAALVLIFGVLLLAGYMTSERLAGF